VKKRGEVKREVYYAKGYFSAKENNDESRMEVGGCKGNLNG